MVVICPHCGAKNRVDESRAGSAICGRCKQPLSATMTRPVELSDATFAQFLDQAGQRPALIDCWAPWCGPCRMLAPTIEQLAAESAGRYVVGKLNTDENPRTASQFNIASIPTLLIFKNGALVDRVVGVHPKPAIAQRLAAQA
jgi:thioredoxin